MIFSMGASLLRKCAAAGWTVISVEGMQPSCRQQCRCKQQPSVDGKSRTVAPSRDEDAEMCRPALATRSADPCNTQGAPGFGLGPCLGPRLPLRCRYRQRYKPIPVLDHDP